MKIHLKFALGLLLLCMLSSCGSPLTDQETVAKEEPVKKIKAAPAQYLEAEYPLAAGDTLFNYKKDNHAYLNEYMELYDTEDGYYYVKDSYLMFIDKESGAYTYLCNQPFCEHKEEENCDAWFNPRDYRLEQGIYCYMDQIYFLGSSDNFYDYSLWKMNLDGTGRQKISDLFRLEDQDQMIPFCMVHRGWMYYSIGQISFSGKANIFRASLKDGRVEKIFETDLLRSTIWRARGYGDGILFLMGYYEEGEDGELGDYDSDIYYLSDNGDIRRITNCDDPIRHFTVDGEMLYYTTSFRLRRKNLKTGKEEDFYDGAGTALISFCENGLILDDWYGVFLDQTVPSSERRLYFLNKDGEEIITKKISLGEAEAMLPGGEDLFMRFTTLQEDGNGVEVCLKRLRTDDLEKGIITWDTVIP